MKGLNLSKFKKIKEDKDWATLIHQDGHSINIAKAPLSPIQRKQLENLQMHYADGTGSVQPVGEFDDMVNTLKGGSDADRQARYDRDAASLPTTNDQPAPDRSLAEADSGEDTEPSAQTEAPAPPPSSPPVSADEVAVSNSGLEQEKQAYANLGAAQAAGYQNQAASLNQGLKQLESSPSVQDVINNGKARDEQLYQAYASKKIDPAAAWSKHANNISSAIGVILGGLGQAVGGPNVQNVGLNLINKQVDAEIDAQKNDQSKALNLWKMNREALGSDIAANINARSQLLTNIKYRLEKAAADSGSPIAKANAAIHSAQIQREIDANNLKLGIYKSNNGNNFQEPEQKLGTMVRLGMIPPTEANKIAEEIKNRRDINNIGPKILEAREQAAQDVRPLTGGLNTSVKAFIPGFQTPGQKKFEGLINTTVKEKEGTARQAAFESIHKTQTPHFGDSDAENASGTDLTRDYLSSNAAAPLAKTYGIDLDQYPSTRLNFAQPSRPQTKVVGGKTYMRGPKGEAILVK